TRVVIPCTPPPIAPNVAEFKFVSTVCGSGLYWLKKLNISARNSKALVSLKRNDFVAEKSKFHRPGSRIAFVRGDVPYWPNCACVNADGLNQRFQVRWSAARFGFWPNTTSGRVVSPVPVVCKFDVTGDGNPLCAVMMVETCQPSSR